MNETTTTIPTSTNDTLALADTTPLNQSALVQEAAAPQPAPTQPAMAQAPMAQPAQVSPTVPSETQADADRSGDAFAISSFVLGIVSIVSGYFVVAPILGLIFGLMARKRPTSVRGLASWGLGINIAILAIWVLLLCFAGLVVFIGVVGGIASL